MRRTHGSERRGKVGMALPTRVHTEQRRLIPPRTAEEAVCNARALLRKWHLSFLRYSFPLVQESSLSSSRQTSQKQLCCPVGVSVAAAVVSRQKGAASLSSFLRWFHRELRSLLGDSCSSGREVPGRHSVTEDNFGNRGSVNSMEGPGQRVQRGESNEPSSLLKLQ